MYNLAGIILIVSNLRCMPQIISLLAPHIFTPSCKWLRLVVDNMMKYGILLKLPNSDQWKSVYARFARRARLFLTFVRRLALLG